MELTRVNCNGCGASLEVAEGALFVTCRYCGANLQITHTTSSVFTQVLDRIDQRTADMAEDLEAIRRQQVVEGLDREWALRRESLLVHGKDGSTHAPSATNGVIGMVIGLVGGCLWTGFALSMGAPVFFPLFGLLFIGLAVAGGVRSLAAASAYQRQEDEYRRRRAEALSALEQSRADSPSQ